ncbi:MAG: GDP-mannose 4,6-dehydratase [Candidatus Auribacterota bacterium]|jgi:UDP-glucuronate 4-epimerase|nr:GDP-mannose 4,6-dehydratase [Candidatus Auribacterota bacterium]
MKILVTGGAGFIGSHLTQRLLDQGHSVCCIDNFNTYYDPKIKRENCKPFLNHPNYRLYELDIQFFDQLKPIFFKENFESVVHLAARAGVRPSIQDPDLYNRVNVIGTTNLLDLARHTGVRQFIFGSSSSVYGINSKVPFSENDRIDRPISQYAATKIAGEMMCHVYHNLYNIHITSLRFFTVYGPRQRPEMAIHKFAEKIYNGESIPFFGDGTSLRDYTFIDDIVSGVVSAIEKNYPYEVFNLGNSNTISLRELVSLIEQNLGKKANLKIMDNQLGDVPITYADISRSKEKLGYQPKTDIKDGIRKFTEWFLSKKK